MCIIFTIFPTVFLIYTLNYFYKVVFSSDLPFLSFLSIYIFITIFYIKHCAHYSLSITTIYHHHHHHKHFYTEHAVQIVTGSTSVNVHNCSRHHFLPLFRFLSGWHIFGIAFCCGDQQFPSVGNFTSKRKTLLYMDFLHMAFRYLHAHNLTWISITLLIRTIHAHQLFKFCST